MPLESAWGVWAPIWCVLQQQSTSDKHGRLPISRQPLNKSSQIVGTPSTAYDTKAHTPRLTVVTTDAPLPPTNTHHTTVAGRRGAAFQTGLHTRVGGVRGGCVCSMRRATGAVQSKWPSWGMPVAPLPTTRSAAAPSQVCAAQCGPRHGALAGHPDATPAPVPQWQGGRAGGLKPPHGLPVFVCWHTTRPMTQPHSDGRRLAHSA